MERPWGARAKELEATEGHWAGFAAFKEWFEQRDRAINCRLSCLPILGSLDGVQEVKLYEMFCDAIDSVRTVPQ